MRADAQLPSQFRRLVGMAVADAIVMVFWNNSPMCYLSQLVIAVGNAVQQQLRDHAWPIDSLLCLSAAAGPMKCHRQVRQCFIEMPLQDSRIACKTSKLLRKVRLTSSFAHGMGRCGVHAEISARNAEALH